MPETTTTVIEGRLVAFLDVLGFSAKLREVPLNELFDTFAKVVDDIKTKTLTQVQTDQEGRTNFEFSQFMSDSLILVSHPINDPYNVNNFIMAVSEIMQMGFKAYFPFRGAITLSDVIFDDQRNIFLANKFPDVVKFEGQQEWTGCVILDEAREAVDFGHTISEPPQNRVTDLLHLVEVPLKNGQSRAMACVNVFFPLCFESFRDQLSYLTEPKRTNTEKHFMAIAKSGFEAENLTEEFLPATFLLVMKTRTGFRPAFLDENMRLCEPGCKEFAWTAVGEAP